MVYILIIIIFYLKYYSYDYKMFIKTYSKTNVNNNSNINMLDENSKLKEELNKCLKENTELKNKINNLNNDNIKLKNDLVKANKIISNFNNNQNIKHENNDMINNLKELIKIKDNEINNLKYQMQKGTNIKPVNFDDIMVINFISLDQTLNCGIKCLKTDTFAEVEERLYQQYEKYRETNNNFIAKGRLVLRFKKIGENNITNGDKVQLIKIE